jgi:predicted alpha/beta superfamily hydrolase
MHLLSNPNRRRLLATGAWSLAGLTCSPASAASDWQSAALPLARQRDIVSTVNGLRYRLFVGIPEGAAPAAGHPVLYALDGNATFPSLALMARSIAARTRVTGQVAPVVVGIGYVTERDYDPARTRDYTPAGGQDAGPNEGGADRFLDVIEQDIKPLVRALAQIDPARQALFGHSYGGLCALHALFTRPAAFSTYIAASPSIWYGGRIVLASAGALRQRVRTLPSKPSLLLTAGELERPPAPPGGAGSINPAAAQRRMVEEASELAARLQATPDVLARVRFQLLAGENHGSALFPAMARALEFFLA